MASSFEGIDAPTVQIFPMVWKGGDGMEREGGKGGGGREGMESV